MKTYKVLRPIWSQEHAKHFYPGDEVELDLTAEEEDLLTVYKRTLELIAGVEENLEPEHTMMIEVPENETGVDDGPDN